MMRRLRLWLPLGGAFALASACGAGSAEVKVPGDSGAEADSGQAEGDGGAEGGGDGAGDAQSFAIYINEIMASNATLPFEGGPAGTDPWTPDWLELYNPSGRDLPLDGYRLSDDPEEPDKARLDGLLLPAGGHLLLLAAGEDASGAAQLPFTLDRDAESLTLYNPQGQPLDRVEWTDLGTQWVAARVPDGGALRLITAASPGAANPESR